MVAASAADADKATQQRTPRELNDRMALPRVFKAFCGGYRPRPGSIQSGRARSAVIGSIRIRLLRRSRVKAAAGTPAGSALTCRPAALISWAVPRGAPEGS